MASVIISARCTVGKPSVIIARPPPGSPGSAAIACFISATLRTGAGAVRIPILTPANSKEGEDRLAVAILAVAASGPNAGPKAEGNGRPDHERDHKCVP